MAKYFQFPFAENGNKAVVPDTTGGSEVSYEFGYSPAYELPKTNPDRRNIDRQPFNGVLNDITANTKEWQEQAFPEIVADGGDGNPVSYPVGFVGRSAGVYYEAVVDGTATVPPSTEWVAVPAGSSASAIVYEGLKSLKPLRFIRQKTTSFYASGGMGGEFYYNSTVDKSLSNGGTIIAPEAIEAWDGTQSDLSTLLAWSGVGTGCYIRLNVTEINPEIFGALMDGITDDSLSAQTAANNLSESGELTLNGLYRFKGIELPNCTVNGRGISEISVDFTELGDGSGFTNLLFTHAGGATDIKLRGFVINGNWDGQTRIGRTNPAEFSNCVYFEGLDNVEISGVELKNCSSNNDTRPESRERITYSTVGIRDCANVILNGNTVTDCISETITTYLCDNVFVDGLLADTESWSTLNVIYAVYGNIKNIDIMQRGEGSRINAICTDLVADNLTLRKDSAGVTSANGIQVSNENNEEAWPQNSAVITDITGVNVLEVVKQIGQYSLGQELQLLKVSGLTQLGCNIGVSAGYVKNLVVNDVTGGSSNIGAQAVSAVRLLVDEMKGPKYVNLSDIKGEFVRGAYILDAYSVGVEHTILKFTLEDVDVTGNRPMYSDNNWNSSTDCSIDDMVWDNISCRNSGTSFSVPVDVRRVNRMMKMTNIHQEDYDNDWSIRLGTCHYMINCLTAGWLLRSKSQYPYHFRNSSARVSIVNGLKVGATGDNIIVRFSDSTPTDVVIANNSPAGYVDNIVATL